jgi:hypothetical protein
MLQLPLAVFVSNSCYYSCLVLLPWVSAANWTVPYLHVKLLKLFKFSGCRL